MRWLCTVVLLMLAAPALASGETLTAAPNRGPAGASVRLTYSTNYGPGGCAGGEVVQLFLDASPLGTATMDPRTCSAARTAKVPAAAGCGRHVFRAAWRTRQNPTLYGEAAAAFVLTCTGTSAPAPSSHPPPATPRARPAHSVTAGPSPSRVAVPVSTPSGVPVPTAEPSQAAAPEPAGSGSHTLLWTLLGLAAAGALAEGLRRSRRT